MLTINLGPFGRFELSRLVKEPPLPATEVFPPIGSADEYRIDRLRIGRAPTLPAITSLTQAVDENPPPYSSAPATRDDTSYDSPYHFPGSKIIRSTDPLSRHDINSLYASHRSKNHVPVPLEIVLPVRPRTKAQYRWVALLRCWLIEIIALNLAAKFDELKTVLDPEHSNTYNEGRKYVPSDFVLSCDEELELLICTRAITKSRQTLEQIQVPNYVDALIVRLSVIRPAREIDPLCGDFVLDLLGWYAESRPGPTACGKTLPEFWSSKESSRTGSVELYSRHMRSFDRLIHKAATNTEVKVVLEKALEKCWRGSGRGRIEYEARYLSIRAEYGELSKMLEIRCIE
jgi:hypothetical protein